MAHPGLVLPNPDIDDMNQPGIIEDLALEPDPEELEEEKEKENLN